MAWKGIARNVNAMERFDNGVEMPMEWNGITWQGMTMERQWRGMEMAWHK